MSDPIKEYAKQFHTGEAPKTVSFTEQPPKPIKAEVIRGSQLLEIAPRKGYVYYAWDGNGRIKIGMSVNPWSRVREMRCANPSIEVLIAERTDDMVKLERERQEQFKEYHLALEWFRAGEKILEHVNELRTHVGKRGSVSSPVSPADGKYPSK